MADRFGVNHATVSGQLSGEVCVNARLDPDLVPFD